MEILTREILGKRDEVDPFPELADIFENQRDPNSRNQRRNAGSIAQRAIREALNHHAHDSTHEHRSY